MENNEAKQIILNAVFEFINSDMNVSRNWRSGFSGAPCGLDTLSGNCKLLHKVVGDDFKKDFAIWQNPDLVSAAISAVAEHYGFGKMKWHWELPTLRAAIWAKQYNIKSPKTIKSVWGLSNPRIEAIVSAL